MADEILIRLGAFLGIFTLLALLERRLPRRAPLPLRPDRWRTNLGLAVIDALALRLAALAVPVLAVAAAIDAERLGLGLFNRLDAPPLAEGLAAVLLFDLAIWAQHWLTHRVPLFWRFHRVHHADRDFDVTTALRFHPVEMLASAGVKVGLVYLLGPSALAVLAFELLLNATALFTHANLALPARLDRLLRLVLVTPDMHRVHHSVNRAEHDRNFGFALSLWDRIFRTYLSEPKAGQTGMTVGLEWQDEKPARLGWALMLPFRR
jgi:sterol desaturase/sphingolipid hydroxylase (fatty acid hydroxylase superfamily)